MANIDAWHELLVQWSAKLLAHDEIRKSMPPDVVASGWLGCPPATEPQIRATEERLGIIFPPSYRAFVQVSNGWPVVGHMVHSLRPVERVQWYRTENLEAIHIYMEELADLVTTDEEYFVYGEEQESTNYRPEYLFEALQVSDYEDSSVYLLNSAVHTPEGEWEAWFFADWRPGADRFRTFWDLMQDAYLSNSIRG